MTKRVDSDKIELHLIRVLKTLITERSVSRAAYRLQSSQPAVSAQLKRLRQLTGDPLLVRAGNAMVPTEVASRMLEPATRLLQDADRLFGSDAAQRSFDPSQSTHRFCLAASDYLDPLFLPHLVTHLKRQAPLVHIELWPLSSEFDYRRGLGAGDVDLVIGNWLQPPDELHQGRLLSDEIVCLIADTHPMARVAGTRAWNAERYLACEHVAPTPLHANAVGVIDEHLRDIGMQRHVAVRSAHFSLIPMMVAQSLLVLTTGRQFCARYVDTLPVRIVRCPVPFPALNYYQLWHERTHNSPAGRWLREQVREVARQLAGQRMPRRLDVPLDA